jgi:hypothetical protein
MPNRPTRKTIAEEDSRQLRRQSDFRRAADAVTAAFALFSHVRTVALFGSVATPLEREIPRFQPYLRFGIEILHECKDVDLAVWIDRLDNLAALNEARNSSVTRLLRATGIGVAHHQIDIFLLEPGTDRYLGRLCDFAECPKGKRECLAPGCGREKFLQQHEGFVFYADALAGGRSVRLFDREAGYMRRTSDIFPSVDGNTGSS